MANTDRYTQHVDSIQPTQAEASVLRNLDVAFLEMEASWPPLLLNYIYRWMHRHNLYHLGPSRAATLSALIDSFVQRTSLPPTEHNKSVLASKCSALIRGSTLEWRKDCLLVQRGCGFSKHTLLKTAWAAHEESFQQAESTFFRSLPQVEHCQNDSTVSMAADGGEEKRGADMALSGRSTKKQRTDDPDNASSDTSSSDCIDMDERVLQASESSPSTRASPGTASLQIHHLDQEKVRRNQDSESPPSPTPPQRHDVVSGTHLPASHQTPLTTAGSAVAEADLQPDEIRKSTVVSGTLSQRPSAGDGGVPSTAACTQEGVQPTALALPHATKPSDALSATLPEAATSGHIGMNGSVSVIRLPTLASILSSPTSRSTAPGLEDPNLQKQHLPPRPRDKDFPKQASEAPTMESSGIPPVTITPTTRLQSPPRPSRRSLQGASTPHFAQAGSMDSSREKPYQTLAPNPSYAYEVATLVSRRGHDTATSQRFQSIGRILIPLHNQPMGGFILGVNTLMSQSVTEFFAHYAGLVRNGEYFSGLKFEFLDVITGGQNWSTIVAPNDRANFQALKQFAFTSFATSLSENSRLEEFRILVTPVTIPSQRDGRNSQPTSSTATTRTAASKIAQSTQPNFRFMSREQSSPPYSMVTSKETVDRGHAPTALQADVSARGPKQRSEAGSSNPTPPQITVRIQVDKFRRMSGSYPGAVLSPRVKNTEFFAWFAREVRFDDCMGPEELTFTFRDALPTPKNNHIARGNEEHFDYMKQDMRPVCEHVAARMPGLTEFVILVTVPAWDRKADEW